MGEGDIEMRHDSRNRWRVDCTADIDRKSEETDTKSYEGAFGERPVSVSQMLSF